MWWWCGGMAEVELWWWSRWWCGGGRVVKVDVLVVWDPRIRGPQSRKECTQKPPKTDA